MGEFLQFLAEHNQVGLNFEKKTAQNINKWLSENEMSEEFKASRFKPKKGQRSENFPDVYIQKKDGSGFFVECKEYSRANMINARFTINDDCSITTNNPNYKNLAILLSKSEQFNKFKKFMLSKQKLLDNKKPIDIYCGKQEFDVKKLIPKYNKLVRNGFTESDCKEFDLDNIRKSTIGVMSCALAWRLINKCTWDICQIKTNFQPYLLGKYGDDTNVKYLQLGENLFVIDQNDNPLQIDVPALPNKIMGLFTLRFTPRFGVGGMYITPRSEIKDKLLSEIDFNKQSKWPAIKK